MIIQAPTFYQRALKLLRGDRLSKFAGQVASYAPRLGAALSVAALSAGGQWFDCACTGDYPTDYQCAE